MRPMMDSRTPRRSSGTASGSKPPPRSRTKTCERPGELGVDGDVARVGRELGGVHHRLARRRDERVGGVADRRVAHGDHLDRHAVRVLDLGGRLLERGRQARRRGRAIAGEEPAAELALLRAGELRHGARVVGALLDERKRLENRVVDVRGHLGALLRADALGALGGEVAAEAPPERRQDERQGEDHDHDREDRVAERVEGAGAREDDQRRPADEGGAEAAAVDVAEAVALGRGRGVARRAR